MRQRGSEQPRSRSGHLSRSLSGPHILPSPANPTLHCRGQTRSSVGVTRGHKKSLRVIRSHQRLPEVTKGHQGSSEITRGYQRLPEATRGYQKSPKVTRGHQRSPRVTRGHRLSYLASERVVSIVARALCVPVTLRTVRAHARVHVAPHRLVTHKAATARAALE